MAEQRCLGERYLGCGAEKGELILRGTPGNALGAYLNGADIVLYGNAQDATGDTMNSGSITVYGNTGDAVGYAMRGGAIYVQGNAGYRAGIHMKEYQEKVPLLMIGGRCGSFLGEYQAVVVIVVLGLGCEGKPIVGNFCGTGMHGGKIYLRTETLPPDLPAQVVAAPAEQPDMEEISEQVALFCGKFGLDPLDILKSRFYVLRPNTKNPYKQLYVYS